MPISNEREQYIEKQALAVRDELNGIITKESLEDFAFRKLNIGHIAFGNGATHPGVMDRECIWYGATIRSASLLYLAHEIGHVLLETYSQDEANLFSLKVNKKSKLGYDFIWDLDGIAQFVVYGFVDLLPRRMRAEYLYNHSTRKENPYK